MCRQSELDAISLFNDKGSCAFPGSLPSVSLSIAPFVVIFHVEVFVFKMVINM